MNLYGLMLHHVNEHACATSSDAVCVTTLLRFYEILQKNFDVNFSACVKSHVETEWEISRMCEIDV